MHPRDMFLAESGSLVLDSTDQEFALEWYRRGVMAARPPDVLFDGFAVLQALDSKAKVRTSAENVSDVLDAVVRLMRSNAKVTGAEGVRVD